MLKKTVRRFSFESDIPQGVKNYNDGATSRSKSFNTGLAV